jgi:hypothetical protein
MKSFKSALSAASSDQFSPSSSGRTSLNRAPASNSSQTLSTTVVCRLCDQGILYQDIDNHTISCAADQEFELCRNEVDGTLANYISDIETAVSFSTQDSQTTLMLKTATKQVFKILFVKWIHFISFVELFESIMTTVKRFHD